MKFSLLIFDLDGTLIDSRKDIAIAANWTREKLGFPPIEESYVTAQIGGGVRALLHRILPEAKDGQVEKGLHIFREYYLVHCLDHTQLYSGTKKMLGALSSMKLAVVTNKPSNMTEKILEGLGVRSVFSSIRGGDDIAKKKPDPAMIHEVMEELGVGAGKTIMVGDSPVDVEAAKRAGIPTCGVTYGGISKTEALLAAKPDFIAHSPAELVTLFR